MAGCSHCSVVVWVKRWCVLACVCARGALVPGAGCWLVSGCWADGVDLLAQPGQANDGGMAVRVGKRRMRCRMVGRSACV